MLNELPPPMQSAILQGLDGTSSALEPVCSTGASDYADFVTLGICSHCITLTVIIAEVSEYYKRNRIGYTTN
jgi:hypothetical protein